MSKKTNSGKLKSGVDSQELSASSSSRKRTNHSKSMHQPSVSSRDSISSIISQTAVQGSVTTRRRADSPIGTAVFPNDEKLKDNIKFYRNEIKSKPFPGDKIDDMLKWKGDYSKLEYNHQYIQWLFPLPEGKGLNYSAQALQQHEAIEIQSNQQTKLRVLRAYTMMLDFYGMDLVSSESGQVKRANNYVERFQHLNRSMHNYRRITRIIKSVGFLGYGNLQAPLVKFIIREAVLEKTLSYLNGGSIYHWIDAIADETEKEKTMNYFLRAKDGHVDLKESGSELSDDENALPMVTDNTNTSEHAGTSENVPIPKEESDNKHGHPLYSADSRVPSSVNSLTNTKVRDPTAPVDWE